MVEIHSLEAPAVDSMPPRELEVGVGITELGRAPVLKDGGPLDPLTPYQLFAASFGRTGVLTRVRTPAPVRYASLVPLSSRSIMSEVCPDGALIVHGTMPVEVGAKTNPVFVFVVEPVIDDHAVDAVVLAVNMQFVDVPELSVQDMVILLPGTRLIAGSCVWLTPLFCTV